MNYDAEIEALAKAVVSGLNLRSKRIREEATDSLINDIELEIESCIETAEWREEDYEDGVRDGVITPSSKPARWWEFWRCAE